MANSTHFPAYRVFPLEDWHAKLLRKYPHLDTTHYAAIHEFDAGAVVGDSNSFAKDLHILSMLDAYVAPRIQQMSTLDTVLEVGIGNWPYVRAVGAFIRHFNKTATLTGIDADEYLIPNANLMRFAMEMDKGTRVLKKAVSEINDQYDLVLSFGTNIPTAMKLSNLGTSTPLTEYFAGLRKATAKHGLVVLGLADNCAEPGEIKPILEQFFTAPEVNRNEFRDPYATHPNNYIITAKPK